jgi:hypothetical protein
VARRSADPRDELLAILVPLQVKNAPALRKARQPYSLQRNPFPPFDAKDSWQPAIGRRGGPEPTCLGFDGGIGGGIFGGDLGGGAQTHSSVENVPEPAERLACDSTASVAFQL